jgi:hypothetical protein
MFLGDDLLPLLVLAFGGAMTVGMLLALVRPPDGKERPPVGRALTMAGIGAIAALWAIASLVGS